MGGQNGSGDLAGLLRRFRERAALTQEELAERAQLTAKAIGALERCERRRPYPHTVRALADALGLDDAERAALSAAARSGAAAPKASSEPATVPAPPTRLIGRDRERAEIVDLLRVGTRLLTLTGPGGIGKTSLALDVAHAMTADFPDGVTVVELAPIGEARLVMPTVARALGVRQLAEPLVDGLAGHLGNRRVLVVLDNVEQVLAAAPDVAELLARAPGLTVLATSRAALRIRAEHELPLGPLPVPGQPSLTAVANSAAAQVFLDRARAAGRQIALTDATAPDVAAICRRLDGLPLALELAASHARYLDPKALLARLDHAVSEPRSRDLPARQRTINATLDWSHDLLTLDEQVLLRRLAVFAGGFTLAAAEDVSQADVLATLGGLVDQSLVIPDGDRYRMLEPIRQYAAAKLAASGEADTVADRAADHYLQLAAGADEGLQGSDQRAWLDLLQQEHDNLGATFGRLVAAGRHADTAHLGRNTWLYWALRGNAVEGLGWLAQIQDYRLFPTDRAARDVAVAGLRYATGDIPGIVGPAAAAAGAARKAGDKGLLAEALVLGGSAAMFLQDFDSAAAQLAEARAFGNLWAQAHAAQAESRRLLSTGYPDEAARTLAEAEAAARTLGNPFALAAVLNAQATLARLGGTNDEALARLQEAVALAVEVGTTWSLAYSLPELAALAAEREQPDLAAQLFGAGAEAASVTAAVPPDPENASRWLNAARDQLGEDVFRRAWERGRTVRGDDVRRLAEQVTRGPG